MNGKIYCFQYDITDNHAYRQEYEYRQNKGSRFIYLDLSDELDDNDVSFCKTDVEKDQAIDVAIIDGHKIIYLYTFIDDINRALEVMSKRIEIEFADIQRKYEQFIKIREEFNKTKACIKEKYPDGKRY